MSALGALLARRRGEDRRERRETAPALRLAIIVVLSALALGAFAWAGMRPLAAELREQVHVIPKGTWSRRMAGEKLDVLPQEIHLTLGVKDVLVLVNQDEVPQQFGPVLMMPGQSFRLPFNQASEYQFACTAHVSGYLTVIVAPAPPWWRLFLARGAQRFAPAG